MLAFWRGAFGALFLVTAAEAAPFDQCAEHLPLGLPTLSISAKTTPLFHPGYAALHDDELLVARWVAYKLTGPHTLGCLKRTNNFHVEESLPKEHRATPADYRRSGYDKGHQAPAQDFAWNADLLSDSFSMVNMAPQLPSLNRQGWERLEEMVRAWALDRGAVIVYVGPIILKSGPTIGPNHVTIPIAFWKVVVDPQRQEAIAFRMPQQKVAKADVARWEISLADLEQLTGLTLPLPEKTDPAAKPTLWPANLGAWRSKKRAACRSTGSNR